MASHCASEPPHNNHISIIEKITCQPDKSIIEVGTLLKQMFRLCARLRVSMIQPKFEKKEKENIEKHWEIKMSLRLQIEKNENTLVHKPKSMMQPSKKRREESQRGFRFRTFTAFSIDGRTRHFEEEFGRILFSEMWPMCFLRVFINPCASADVHSSRLRCEPFSHVSSPDE